eukprot:9470499-Pyramimonas_sp.AAC.1
MPTWYDTRNKVQVHFRARPGMPLGQRLRQRMLPSLWPDFLSKLQGPGRWVPSCHEFGVKGARGEFSTIDSQEDDHWVLFHTEQESEN